jgi:DNA-binding CsgD family transcriptional regulator
MERRAEYARAALEITDTGATDASVAAQALIVSTLAELCLGKGLRRDLMDRAVELELVSPPDMVSARATTSLGEFLMRCDDVADARPCIEASVEVARATDESSRCEALACAAQLELISGDWDRAETLLLECLDVAEWSGQPIKTVEGLRLLAPLHAARGRVEAADLEIASLRGLAAELNDSNAYLLADIAEGTVAFHGGNLSLAAERLAIADAEDERQHMREPGYRRYLGDLVEALIGTGRADEANQVLARFERMAVSLDRPSARASSARCGALLAADAGDMEDALAACDEAHRQHARLDAPFELARTLLVEAALRRRMRQKAVARELFEEAAAIFERLRAAPWAERARAEQERIGGGAGAGSALTTTERRVAELVAGGMKNREVAATLFISPRSVEANLTKVYRKLGVSRAALGARLNEPRRS